MSLGALAALIERSRLLICNDTGVSQLAAAVGCDSVVIVGTSSMQRWAPQNGARHRCLFDPWGDRLAEVCAHARELLLAQRSPAPA